MGSRRVRVKATRSRSRSRSRSASRPRAGAKRSRPSNTTPGFSGGADVASLVPAIVRSVHPYSAYPQRKRLTLKYADAQIINAPTTSTGGILQYRANSLFDFDLTGTGHQPKFYDQFCTATGPYTVYRVLGVRIKITLCDIQQAGVTPPIQMPVLMTAGFSTSATAPVAPTGSLASTIWGFTEIPGYSGCIVPVNGSRSLSFQRTMADIFGVSPIHVMGEDNYQGVYNGNPVNVAYFNVMFQTGDYSNDVDCNFTIHAEFDVQFENPLFNITS